MWNAEDMLVVAELPITGDINELPFELFVCVGEVTYKLLICGGCEVVVSSASARYKGITVLNIFQTEL